MRTPDRRADALALELDMRRHPVYRANLRSYAGHRLAAWGHRDELHIRGRRIRRGTIPIGSVEDWHRERYLNYGAEMRARAVRMAAALRTVGVGFRDFAETMRRTARALAGVSIALGRPAAPR